MAGQLRLTSPREGQPSLAEVYARKDNSVGSKACSSLGTTLSPRTPSPNQLERSALTSTPTPTRFHQAKGAEGTPSSKPPRYVYYALRQEDDAEIGFSALNPEEAVEPTDALSQITGFQRTTQFVFATASPEAALFFAESGGGPGFASARPGLPRSASKRVVSKIDLSSFKGEVLDISTAAGCEQHGIKKDSQAWDTAMDLKMILLVGYVHPRHVTANFDLVEKPMPSWRAPINAAQNISFESFSAALHEHVKRILAKDWAGDAAGQCLQCATGRKERNAQGLANDKRSHAAVCWDAKQKLDDEMRKLEARRQRLAPHLETVMDRELARCDIAFQKARHEGSISSSEESRVLVMKNWSCLEEFPYWAATQCHQESEVWLRGTQYQTRLALNGPATMEKVHCVASDANQTGCLCSHCMWTKPAEFHLLRNVKCDGQDVKWPPYFRLFCFDPATEELDELLNTLGGAHIRDSEHPHVFPSDEVGFSFALDRLPTALAGLEATLPRSNIEDTSEVALPLRPLYLVLVVPEGVPFMKGVAHESAPLYVPPCDCGGSGVTSC